MPTKYDPQLEEIFKAQGWRPREPADYEAERLLRDTIAPGTIGDPADPVNDIPPLQGAGGPLKIVPSDDVPEFLRRDPAAACWKHETNGGHAAEPPPATSADEYGAEAKPTKREAQISIIEPSPYIYRPAIEIPKRAWLYGRHYLRNCVSATIAPPGWTKSTRTLTEFIVMALRRPLLGEMPNADRPLRCWYWSGEDEREEVERRIAALCQHHNIDARELEGLLFISAQDRDPSARRHRLR